jgi:hypothetical protein
MMDKVMFEYHGWAVVRDDAYGTDESRMQEIVAELQTAIDDFGDGSGMTDVRWVNGQCMVHFAGCPNHRHDQVFALFPWLAARAPGSYGLLYVWDDENPRDENEFRVWVLLRGRVEEEGDRFLSPCVPTIEDAHDPRRAE